MSKFKNGDWVRVLHTDFEDEFPVGSVAQVHEADGVVFLMHASGKLCFYDSELEPWQPKVGERVRAKGRRYGISAGDGFIKKIDGLYLVEFIDGWCSGHDGDIGDEREIRWWHSLDELEPAAPVAAEAQPAADTQAAWAPKVGDRVTVSWGHGWNGEGVVTAVYEKTANVVMDSGDFACAEGGFTFAYLKPFRIESGRYYKTRDGRKVGPMRAYVSECWPDEKWSDGNWTYRDDGTWGGKDGSQPDLIAEWPAATKPLVAATVDYLADEYGSGVKAEPKFKVGDKVDYLRDRDGQWLGVTIDRVEMTSFGTMGYWGRGKNGHTGLFEGDDIVLSRPITQPTAIVARIDNGQPRPNPTPFVHHSQEAAAKEAERLANVHRGKQFGVYVLTGEPACVERTYDHEWQRLAANGNKIDAIRELRGITGIGLHPAKVAVNQFVAQEAA